MAVIYKIVNSKNNKVYIGKTIRTLQIRWNEHKKDYLYKDNKLYRAMRKYGIENFSIEIIEDNIPNNEVGEKEREYIKLYNSYYNGYNSTFGGEGESNVDFSAIEKLFLQGMNCMQIHKKLGYTVKTISSQLRAHNYTVKKIPGNKGKGKEVIFEETVYPSITVLAEYLIKNNNDFKNKKVNTVIQGISSAIKKNRSYLGYDFKIV